MESNGRQRVNPKFAEGKMFLRMECDDCSARFHFAQTPRVTRIPRCPACASLSARPAVSLRAQGSADTDLTPIPLPLSTGWPRRRAS